MFLQLLSFNLAQFDGSAAPAFYAFLSGALLALLAKIGVLVWSYLKTRKLAPMVYGLYIIAQTILPLFLTRLLNPSIFAIYAGGMWLLEIGLFVWLIYSLSARSRRVQPIAPDAPTSEISTSDV